MIEIIVQENDAQQRLDRFLMKMFPTMPKNLMYKLIRNKKIKVNRKKSEISYRLQEKDKIQCFISDEFRKTIDYDFQKVPSDLQIIYEDEHVLIANKEIGILSQKDSPQIQDNMQDRLLHYLYINNRYRPEEELSFKPSFIHRLDRNTSGLMIAGKNKLALNALYQSLQNNEIEKRYLCIVEGQLKQKEKDVFLWHRKDTKQNKSYLSANRSENAKKVHTSYKLIAETNKMSLVEVNLKSGKSHQIRATFSYLNHPLLGDIKYGAKKRVESKGQFLCAYKLNFCIQEKENILYYLNEKEFIIWDNFVKKWFDAMKSQ